MWPSQIAFLQIFDGIMSKRERLASRSSYDEEVCAKEGDVRDIKSFLNPTKNDSLILVREDNNFSIGSNGDASILSNLRIIKHVWIGLGYESVHLNDGIFVVQAFDRTRSNSRALLGGLLVFIARLRRDQHELYHRQRAFNRQAQGLLAYLGITMALKRTYQADVQPHQDVFQSF